MTSPINTDKTLSLIEELVSIESPTGNTSVIISHIEQFFNELEINTARTKKGGLLVTLEGNDTGRHRLLTAHVDTLGAMVKEIKGNGRLKLSMIGGFRWNSVEGEYCKIETSSGKTYSGTILLNKTSVHVYKDYGTEKRDDDHIEVRIDEKVHTAEDVKALGISVGDFVSFAPRVERTDSGFIKSRHLDDKASVGILMEAFRTVKKEGTTLPHTTHVLISNNEEIGYGGNSNIPEETVEYLAVDMGAIGDGQTTDEYSVSICAKDSSGPYHYGLRKQLVKLAEEHVIDYRVDIYPYYGSDASAAVRAGHDVIHGLIGPGVDASHAFERTHRDSVEHTAHLVYRYMNSPILSY
ncbi:M42 family metallopeptidase [Bacillus marinisedimentorum]|uniref:M42 family metallopeptidase n=1 Tax=Bacillus marinisedimentorum TaxID=1821260 RepID=UPI0007E215FB|nr:M42 family metallopeptidase [Bacillus marinisedimentorum]